MLQSRSSLPLRPCFCNSGKKGPWCPRLRLGWERCVARAACDGNPVPCRAFCPLTASPGGRACSWALCWALAGFVRWSCWNQPYLSLCDVQLETCSSKSGPQTSSTHGTWLEMESLGPHLGLPKSVCILTRRPGGLWARKSLRSALLEDCSLRGATEGVASFGWHRCPSLQSALGQCFSNSEMKDRWFISFFWGWICGPMSMTLCTSLNWSICFPCSKRQVCRRMLECGSNIKLLETSLNPYSLFLCLSCQGPTTNSF